MAENLKSETPPGSAEPNDNLSPTEASGENPVSPAPEIRPRLNLQLMGRTLIKLSILPFLGVLGYVIFYGGFGMGRDTTDRIHDLRNPSACIRCHPGDPFDRLNRPEPELCFECHTDAMHRSVSHPVNIPVEVNSDPGLPLFNGMMTCSTCHEPHGKTDHPMLLRRIELGLCLPCHPEKKGMHHSSKGK